MTPTARVNAKPSTKSLSSSSAWMPASLEVRASKVALRTNETITLSAVLNGVEANQPIIKWSVELGHGRLTDDVGSSVSFQAATSGGAVILRATWIERPMVFQRLLLNVHPLPQTLGCGNYHSLAVSADGHLLAWGGNEHQQLGEANLEDHLEPGFTATGQRFVSVGAGIAHSVALRADGTLLTWGDNPFGQLGGGFESVHRQPVTVGHGFKAFAVGVAHAVAVRDNGDVTAWGFNYFGQLGDGTITKRARPVDIPELEGIVAVSAGFGHSLALRDDGVLFAWGCNDFGQLGNGHTVDCRVPTPVLCNRSIIAAHAGLNHASALTSDGHVLTWGRNNAGQLGNATLENSLVPTPVPDLENIVALSCGDEYTLALRADGAVLSWGRNSSGQLGDGCIANRAEPGRVQSTRHRRHLRRGDARARLARRRCVVRLGSKPIRSARGWDASGSIHSRAGQPARGCADAEPRPRAPLSRNVIPALPASVQDASQESLAALLPRHGERFLLITPLDQH